MAEPNLHPVPHVPFDASDETQVRQREREALRRDKESRDVLAQLLSTRPGRNWMFALLTQCHIFETSFRPDALAMAALEGERNIGLRLMAQINAVSPEAMILMMREKGEANG